MRPVPTVTFRWANVQAGGKLAELILAMSDDGLSPDKIAARLFADYQIDVSGRTISRWLPALNEPQDAA